MGLARPAELEARGVSRVGLYRLAKQGLVERRARGIYVVRDHPYTARHTLAQVAKRVPNGVFCLLTALQFHELTTQLPREVWVAIGEKARRPRLDHLKLRVTRFSGLALTEGIEVHRIEGVDVRVYSTAKTIVDCFKYRNKIGLDVAIEATRDAWRGRRVTMDEITYFARQCRVDRVMRPYLEMLVA
jgi:predicted transcriptional regulator of viral defense system